MNSIDIFKENTEDFTEAHRKIERFKYFLLVDLKKCKSIYKSDV